MNLCIRKRVHLAFHSVLTGIGGIELSTEAEQAMDAWASDTGRTLAPIIGIPLTAIWYTVLFAIPFWRRMDI